MLNLTYRRRWITAILSICAVGFFAMRMFMPGNYRTGDVTTFQFESALLKDHRRVWVYLPPGYDASQEAYPLLILQDGQNVFDGNTSTHQGMEWRVDETLEKMIRQQQIAPLVVVAIDSTETRHDEYLPERVIQNGIEEGGGAERYATMLTDELLPYLHQHYRLLTGPNHTFVGGSSYGGVLSFYLAMQHADTFGAALIMSPSTSWNNRWMKRTADALFWKHNVKLWLDFGYGEGPTGDFVATVEALQAKGWRIPYDLQVVIDGGNHIEAAWARRFPDAINWLMNDAAFIEDKNK